jgi:zinc and cadmium transporter
MSSTCFYSLASTLMVSLISLIGVFTLSMKKGNIKKVSIFLVSFAAGALFGDAFIHLLPESFEETSGSHAVSSLVLLGILLFFVLEKFLHWRHCHLPTSKKHVHPLATINLVGDAVHNFIDGLLIGASYMVSLPVGLATSLAIIFHEIPQEIGDFGVLIHAGFSVRRALLFNFLSAIVAILGAVTSLIVGPNIEGYTVSLLPIAAGGFIYIAGSDLIPELKRECEVGPSIRQFLLVITGMGIMALLLFLE